MSKGLAVRSIRGVICRCWRMRRRKFDLTCGDSHKRRSARIRRPVARPISDFCQYNGERRLCDPKPNVLSPSPTRPGGFASSVAFAELAPLNLAPVNETRRCQLRQ
jgi:hypothetical protein